MKKTVEHLPYITPLVTAVNVSTEGTLCQSADINAALLLPPELPEEDLLFEDFI